MATRATPPAATRVMPPVATRTTPPSPAEVSTAPPSGRKPLLRQTRAVSRMKSVSESSETTPVKEDAAKSEAEDGSGTGDGVQRNLSLEALFQVTHSELKNISRTEDEPGDHGDGGANGEVVQPDGSSTGPANHDPAAEVSYEEPPPEVPPVLLQLQVAEPVMAGHVGEGGKVAGKELVQLRGAEEEEVMADDMSVSSMRASTPLNTLQICVEVPTTPPEALVEVEMTESSPEGKHAVVKLPVTGKGIEKYQLKSDSLEEQGLKLTYTKKTYDQYEPNPISYGTYKPRSYKPTAAHPGDPVLQDPGTPQVGRKRKYPAKPGRHICPYCGRGCAKPSVLQKHIRAHTGERPYPCVPCGFSFKTKSNLYKHCKSRAHAIKAGLSPADPNKDLNKSREESIGEDEVESDSEGEDGRHSDSSTRDGSSRSTSVETGDNPQSAGSSFDSLRSRSKDEHLILQTADSREIVGEGGSLEGIVKLDSGAVIASSPAGPPQMVARQGRVYKTDKQYFDVAYIRQADAVSPVTNVLTDTSQMVLAKRAAAVNSPITTPTGDVLNVTSTVQKESDNSMKVTIKYPPKVTKQQAISFQGSFDHDMKTAKASTAGNFRRSASLPEHAHVKLATTSPAGVGGSGAGRDSRVVTAEAVKERLLQLKGIPPKASVDHKNMTPEMVGERINQLISNNAALLDMPMADAPRPKRMSRQNSEVKGETPGTPRGILSPSLSLDSAASSRSVFQGQGRAKSMEVGSSVGESAPKTISFLTGQGNHGSFLSAAEPTDQPPGSAGEKSESQMMAELVAAAKTATPVPAPGSAPNPNQEYKIQIKLPKAATTDASGVPSVPQPSGATLVLPDLSQPYIGQPSVLLPNPSGMLMRQLSLPLTPQQAPDGSVIRELLLRPGAQGDQQQTAGTGTTVGGGSAPPPSIQMVEIRPDGSTSVINDFTPMVVMDGKGAASATYMTPVTQDPVPMNVAQDVEVVATSDGVPTSPRSQLKRAMSLPQGLPTASSSASPYGNVIFDHYDPKVPPKRGRPKGSKNRVREQLSLNIPSYLSSSHPSLGSSPVAYTSTLRMPLMSTNQSHTASPSVGSRPSLRLTIPQPSVTPSIGIATGTPVLGSTPNLTQIETPTTQSLLKLKLKGKLLMKRSMSVERMLSQERERRGGDSFDSLPATPVQGISSPALTSRSGSLLTPTSYVTNPLLRAASADEATPLKKRRAAFQHARSEDSPIRRLLGHYSADSMLHSFSASTDTSSADPSTGLGMSMVAEAAHVAAALSFDSPEKKEMMRGPSLARQDSLTTPVLRMPANKLSPLAVMVSTPPTIVVSRGTAPTNQYQPFHVHTQPFTAPLLQLSRQDNMQLPQSLFLSLKLSPNVSNLVAARSLSEDKESTGSAAGTPEATASPKLSDGSGSSQSLEKDVSKSDSLEVPSDGFQLKDPAQKTRGPLEKSSSSEGGSLDSSSSYAAGKPLTEKGIVQLLVLGHQCPTLRMLTHTTFCTLAKPQPMYVPQETSKQLSMYSNWRSARYNPNPIGLSSRDLMSLHHLRRYDNDPMFTCPTMGPSKTGVLTHSSYWNYYNKMRALQPGDEEKKGEEEVRTIKQVPEVKMATGVRIAEEQEKVLQATAPSVAMETVVVTTPAVKPKTKEPKRLKVCAGGYKTNEDYIYIRGRGRGKYVCEECGIRCKKPSMLRKHIRTHTDVRPYLCKHCSFSFKTKGNLTKHMKSKAHQKKCIEMGIVPVPVIVDDSQIDPEALALQAQMAKEGRMPSEDDDGAHFSEGDDDDEDDDEGDEDEEDDGHETMMVVDAVTGEVKETIRCQVVRKDSEGPHYVAIQEGDSSQPTLVKIDAKTQAALVQQAKASKQQLSLESGDGDPGAPGQDDQESDQPRPSIDKEIAHSLLDLSKGNEPKKSKGAISLETRRLLRQHSAHAAEEKEKREERDESKEDPDGKGDGTRLDTLIGALMSRTKVPGEGGNGKAEPAAEVGHVSAPLSMLRMATTIYQSAALPTSQTQPSTSDLQHIHRRSQNTYAQKIAALQTANENDLRLTLSRSRVNATGSGFVPPVLVGGDGEVGRTGAAAGAKNLLRRQASVGGLSENVSEDKTTSAESHGKRRSEERPMNLSVDKDTEGTEATKPTGAVDPVSGSSVGDSQGENSGVQYASGETSAPYEIGPTPGKGPDAPLLLPDGKYMCPFCDKIYAEYSQYAYHKNIHYIERPHRCEACLLAFRTKAHLTKHLRSEVHTNKQSVNQQYGTPTSDNPRPFKCDDCKIAFRIHGHLAKHMRSKSHIAAMARLGKAVPPETSADSDIEVLDEDDVSMDAEEEEDMEVERASAKGRSIDRALKDPENLLQPRETTPTPQDPGSTLPAAPTPSKDSPAPPAPPLEADQFHYHKLSDYEKDISASNEKVTVEKIKMEPIDIGTFSSLGSRTEVEVDRFPGSETEAAERVARNREVFRHQAGSGSGEQHPHKCGICGRTFRAINTLKQHLVTHAELRPYVCEYCDAGFTTAQSLKFHLRTHTQERPYICGQCGDTFARSDHLRAHMTSHEEDGEDFPPSPKPPRPPPPPVEAVKVVSSPVILNTAPTFPSPTKSRTVQPLTSSQHTLRPAQGQLLRSASADQHLVRDIRPKVSADAPVLLSDVSGATRRRMAFTSSLSLPLQSGAVQLVPMMPQGGQPGDAFQLVPQPLSVVRMPQMISLQNAGFGGPLQTVLAPTSTSVQTLLLQSPMVLSSMPLLTQPLATTTPTAAPVMTTPTAAITAPVMTTPTITITTPTRVTVTADDHPSEDVVPRGDGPEPVLIPTVVQEKAEEDRSRTRHTGVTQELDRGDTTHPTPVNSTQTPQNRPAGDNPLGMLDQPFITRSVGLTTPSGEVTTNVMLGPVITVTPPDGNTVTEHIPTPPTAGPPSVSLVGRAPPLPLVLPPDPMPPAASSGSRVLATTLIPGDDKAQEELMHALEAQGLSPDKVQVLQVKGENDDNTQYVIVECDGTDKLDGNAIAELINQNKARVGTTPAAEVPVSEVPMSAVPVPAEAEGSCKENTIPNIQAPVTAPSTETCDVTMASEPDVTSAGADVAGLMLSSSAASARQRGILKRQHSIDLADQSGGGARKQAEGTTAPSQPPTKVKVTENSHGECIPQPAICGDTKGQK